MLKSIKKDGKANCNVIKTGLIQHKNFIVYKLN